MNGMILIQIEKLESKLKKIYRGETDFMKFF